MRLAILGLNSQTLALVKSAVEEGHALVAAAEVGEGATRLEAITPGTPTNESWESLLVGDRADLVLVAGPPDDRAWTEFEIDRLRKLVQEAIPVLITPPLIDVNLAYELEMIRRERSGTILTPSRDYRQPGVIELQRSVEDPAEAGLGEIEQVVFERRLADRSRPAVLAQLVEDAALLRRLLGTIKTVSATGGPASEYRDPMAGGPKPVKPLGSVAVHLTGDATFGARWFVSPPSQRGVATVTVEGSHGRAELELAADGNATLRVQTPRGEEETEYAAESLWKAANNTLRRRANLPQETAAVSQPSLFPSWIDVCHDLEAAEAIDRSLVRGRTVNVTTDEPSEEEAFKGVMAAGGCLTLVASLALFLLAGLVEALKLPIRDLPIWRFSPLLPLTPILFFLLLQLFRLAVPARKSTT